MTVRGPGQPTGEVHWRWRVTFVAAAPRNVDTELARFMRAAYCAGDEVVVMGR